MSKICPSHLLSEDGDLSFNCVFRNSGWPNIQGKFQKKIIDNFNFLGISEHVTRAMRCQPRRLSQNYLSGSSGGCGERSFYNILTLKMLMVAFKKIKQLNYSNKTETEANDAR